MTSVGWIGSECAVGVGVGFWLGGEGVLPVVMMPGMYPKPH